MKFQKLSRKIGENCFILVRYGRKLINKGIELLFFFFYFPRSPESILIFLFFEGILIYLSKSLSRAF